LFSLFGIKPCVAQRTYSEILLRRGNEFVASTKRFVNRKQTRMVVVTISLVSSTTVIVQIAINIVVVTGVNIKFC